MKPSAWSGSSAAKVKKTTPSERLGVAPNVNRVGVQKFVTGIEALGINGTDPIDPTLSIPTLGLASTEGSGRTLLQIAHCGARCCI